jgi:pyruvate kinase
VLLLDDGRIVLEVDQVIDREVRCRVRVGGTLSNNKGINKQGGGLSAPALTAKDMEDIRTAAEITCDFVAVSFPKSGADMRQARELLRAAGSDALLVAKIERVEAIAALEDILHASDAIMVARGDLAVEVGDAAVPALQKRLIRGARAQQDRHHRHADDGIDDQEPGADARRGLRRRQRRARRHRCRHALGRDRRRRLSGGNRRRPWRASASKPRSRTRSSSTPLPRPRVHRIDQSIAMAALFTAYHLKVKAIAALTQSGSTALWMSRIHCGVPIFALTPEIRSRYRMSLYRDVYPLLMRYIGHDRDELLREAEHILIESGAVEVGDTIVLTIGEPIGTPGGTNTMKIVRVGEHSHSAGRSSL